MLCEAPGRKQKQCQKGWEHRWGADFSSAVLSHLGGSPPSPRNTDLSFQLWSPTPPPPITLHGMNPNCQSSWRVSNAWGPSWTEKRMLPTFHLYKWWWAAFLSPARIHNDFKYAAVSGDLNRSLGSKLFHGKMMKIKISSTKTEIWKQNRHIWSWLGKGSLMVIWHLVRLLKKE